MKEKIMIIEDNRTIRGEHCVFFEKNEFTPVETGDFTTVEQVVAAVRKVEPKLILLDINLEEISGFDVCREIRKWSGTPILFVTARELSLIHIWYEKVRFSIRIMDIVKSPLLKILENKKSCKKATLATQKYTTSYSGNRMI